MGLEIVNGSCVCLTKLCFVEIVFFNCSLEIAHVFLSLCRRGAINDYGRLV